jgi:hypothetical protein
LSGDSLAKGVNKPSELISTLTREMSKGQGNWLFCLRRKRMLCFRRIAIEMICAFFIIMVGTLLFPCRADAGDYVLSFEERDIDEGATQSVGRVFLDVLVNGQTMYEKDMGVTGPLWHETVPFTVSDATAVQIELRLVFKSYVPLALHFGNIRVSDSKGGETEMAGKWTPAESRPEFRETEWTGGDLVYHEGFDLAVPQGDMNFYSPTQTEWCSYVWSGSLKPAVNLVMNRLFEYVGCYEPLNYYDDYKNISFDPPRPAPGDMVKTTATIWNKGSQEAKNVPIKLTVDGVEQGRKTVTVPPVSSVQADFSWKAATGFHTVAVIADPESKVAETQKDDNSLMRTLSVGAVKNAHPFLFFNTAGIDSLRARIYDPKNTTNSAKYYAICKNYGARARTTNEAANGLYAQDSAVVFAVDGTQGAKDKVIGFIDSSLAGGGNMIDLGQAAGYYGVAYDLVASSLTDSENKMFRARLAKMVYDGLLYFRTRTYPSNASTPEGYPRPMLYQQYSQGEYIQICGLLIAALALNGYDDRTADSPDYDPSHISYGFSDWWIHFGLGVFYNEVLRTDTTSSGYYREGLAYMAMAEDRNGALFYNAFYHTGYNLFTVWPLTAEMHLLVIKSRMPNGWEPPENDSQVLNPTFFGNILYTNLYDDREDQSASSWAMHNLPFTLESGELYNSFVSSQWVVPFLFWDTVENRNIPYEEPKWDPTQFLEDYLVLKTDWKKDSAYLMLSAKHSPTGSVSHDQNDQGSFLMYAKQAYLAVDPGYGQGGTFFENVVKPWCRGSSYAHNMVMVDGQIPKARADVPTSTYTYGNSFFPENTFTTKFLDFAESKMSDWEYQIGINRNVITERRSIVFPRGSDYFILVDDLSSQLNNTHEYSFILQGNSRHPYKDKYNPGDFIYNPTAADQVPLASNMTLSESGLGKEGQWLVENMEGKDVRFKGFFASPSPDKLSLSGSDGWLGYVTYYAARNRYLEAKISKVKNTKYLVILYPDLVADSGDDASIERLPDTQLVGTRSDRGGAKITLQNGRVDRVAIQGVGNVKELLTVDGAIQSDGEIMFCRSLKDKSLESCFMARGTTFSYGDFSTPLVSSSSPLQTVALNFGESGKITGYVSGDTNFDLKIKTGTAPLSVNFVGGSVPFTFEKTTGTTTMKLSGSGNLEIGGITVGVRNLEETMPMTFTLGPNFPNPFNPSTVIPYAVPGGGDQQVELAVYTMTGQKIRTLVDNRRAAGRYIVRWNGNDDYGRQVSSGVYFVRLKSDARIRTIKINYIK